MMLILKYIAYALVPALCKCMCVHRRACTLINWLSVQRFSLLHKSVVAIAYTAVYMLLELSAY